MNKIKPITISNFYNRWLKPYVDTRGDNLLVCEGQLYNLINSTREECIKIVKKYRNESKPEIDRIVKNIIIELAISHKIN